MSLADVTLPGEFFSLASFGTVGGAAAIVFVISNTLQSVFNFNPKWLAFVLSLVVGGVGVAILHQATATAPRASALEYGIGVLNGFLIYLTAAGGTAVLSNAGGKGNPRSEDGKPALPQPPVSALLQQRVDLGESAAPKRGFLHPWF